MIFIYLRPMSDCPPDQETYKRLVAAYLDAYNRFDVAAMTHHLHPAVVFENVVGAQVNLRTEGIEAFRAQAQASVEYFSERQQTPVAWNFKNEQVTVQIDYQAVWAIDLPDGPKAGELIKLRGKSEFYFSKMQIIRICDIT